MAKEGYPESLDCWLKDFPQYLRLTFGPEMENLEGPWGNGSIQDLIRIGFDDPDTSPVEGVVSDDVKVTYSDTGTDVDWILKIGMYGWGTFFALVADDNYYIGLEKWFEIESTYFDKLSFRLKQVVYTRIPKATTIPLVNIPVERIYEPDDSPGYNPPDPSDPAPPPPNPVTGNMNHLVVNLVNAYRWIWNVSSIRSITITTTKTNILGVSGWRRLNGSTSDGGADVDFYLNGGLVKMVFSLVTINCEDFNWVEGFGDCTYSLNPSSAYFLNTLMINGQDRLPDLVRRA